MKRIGYRPIVEVYRSFIVQGIFALTVYSVIAVVMLVTCLPQINVFIGLLYLQLIPLEMWIIDTLFKYMFGKRATVILILYYLSNLVVSIVM